MDGFVTSIRQYPGQQQVTRRVKVDVPGKHFTQLTAAEQAQSYSGQAVEYKERHQFQRHAKAWGAAHTGPGIRFICASDAIDDPDTKGFWTTLLLWNRWRHDTYKDKPDDELQYLDELPAVPPKAAAAVKPKEPPEIKKHFTIVSSGVHTFGGTGKLSGTTAPFTNYACNKPCCLRGPQKPIKQVGSATGQLFTHMETCQPALCVKLRAASKHSPVDIDDDGEEYTLYSFKELLPHHARFVLKCFRGFDHFYEARADNGLIEYLRGYNKRAALPHEQTCQNLLEVYEELMEENIAALINRHLAAFGKPCCGSSCDIWSLTSCRESFGCLRGAFVLDGDMVAQVTGRDEYKGKLVDMSPVLAFERFTETSHTGAVIARWKTAAQTRWKLDGGAVGLATEDGASPNKKANKILGEEMMVCTPHDIARAVLIASGEEGTPCKNPELKALTARSSKQAGSFHRSVQASKALQQAQLDENPDLAASQVKTTKVKNKTRWLGLWAMCNRNRNIGKEIRVALTGDGLGDCAETPAAIATRHLDSSDDDDDADSSDGEDQEEGNRVANKKFPLAHRCLSMEEYRATDVFESLLDRAREITLLVQAETDGWGEGLDIGLTWLAIKVSAPIRLAAMHLQLYTLPWPPAACFPAAHPPIRPQAMREENTADRLELVSGRGELEVWKETNASALASMFKIFRKEFASQLATRFKLDTTPNKHVLLALKMNPSINTDSSAPLLKDKSAMEEMMVGEYKRALRRQCVLKKQNSIAVVSPLAAPPTAAPPTGAAVEEGVTPPTEPTAEPPVKRRKGLLGAVAQAQLTETTPDVEESAIDAQVQAEIERFDILSQRVRAAGPNHQYYEGTHRFNLRTFWADNNIELPLHFAVYVSEVGCKKSAAANVESVFSGAGKFTDEAGRSGHKLISRMVKLHYNWKYPFLRPTIDQVVERYMAKFHSTVPQAVAAGVASSPAGPSGSAGVASSPAGPSGPATPGSAGPSGSASP